MLLVGTASAWFVQVLTPIELSDPKTQHLQMGYFKRLTEIGTEVSAYKFPYTFYFSRTLDLDQSKMAEADRPAFNPLRYIQQPYDRLRETFQQVMMPILQAETPHCPDDSAFSAYAISRFHTTFVSRRWG
jgi:hypothetical protein